MSQDGAYLSLSVWVRLLKAHGLMLRELRPRLSNRLTLPQFDVLVQLTRHREGMTPGELTRALLVTGGNVTGVVERLVRLGLAERRPVPEDRRAIRVRLSTRGRQVMRRAIPRHRRDVDSLLRRMSARERAQLRDLLGRVNSVLESPR